MKVYFKDIKDAVGGILRLLLFVLSANTLYLYYGEAWYDPIPAIEISEVVLLYVFCVASLAWTIHYLLRVGNVRAGSIFAERIREWVAKVIRVKKC